MTNEQWCDRWEEIDDEMFAIVRALARTEKVKASARRMQQLSEVVINLVQAKAGRNTMLGCTCHVPRKVSTIPLNR